MQLATGVSLPISGGQQKGAGLLVAQARTFAKMWRYFTNCLETHDELPITEEAWDLAHVGFRAERGMQAIVPLECPTPTALSLLKWRISQRSTPSSIQSRLETSRVCTPAFGPKGTGTPSVYEKHCKTRPTRQPLRLRELWPETPAQDTSLGQSSTVVQAVACVEDKMEWANCWSLSCESAPLDTNSHDMR